MGVFTLGVQDSSVKTDTDMGTGVLSISGGFKQVQEGLKSLIFMPFKDFCMEANILINVKNLYDLENISTMTATVTLLITPYNDPPVITSAASPGTVYNMTQNQFLSFSSVESVQSDGVQFLNSGGKYPGVSKSTMFLISDVDVGGGLGGADGGQVSAYVSVTCGSLLLTPSTQLSLLSSAGNSLLVSTYNPVTSSKESCSGPSNEVGSGGGGFPGGDFPMNISSENIDFVIGYKGYVLQGDLEMVNAALSSISYQSPSATDQAGYYTLNLMFCTSALLVHMFRI